MADSVDAIRRLLNPERVREIARSRYPLRAADATESQWFSQNPEVAGYAAPVPPMQDRQVVLNPAIPDEWKPSVHANEGFRHYMYESGARPEFFVYPHQRPGEYANDLGAARQTVVARILSGDNSLAPYTEAQRAAASRIAAGLAGDR